MDSIRSGDEDQDISKDDSAKKPDKPEDSATTHGLLISERNKSPPIQKSAKVMQATIETFLQHAIKTIEKSSERKKEQMFAQPTSPE